MHPLSSTTYREPAGIGGINCHHKPPNIFIPGYSYIDEKPPSKAENDAEYALSQEQRRLEREVRYAKRDAAMADAMGDKERFDETALRIKQKQSDLRAFVDKNNLTMRSDRTQVFGYNKSVSSKISASAKAQEAAAAKKVVQNPLPQANDAIIPISKFTEYALNLSKDPNVKTAWILDKTTGEMRLTSAYVTSKKWKDEI